MTKLIEHRITPTSEPAPALELDLSLDTALTVGAWVHSSDLRAEAMQPLVSQWAPRATFDAFSAYDAGTTDSLNTRGYFGAVFDGRYIYFCPIRDQQDRGSVHGRVLRCDTQGEFNDPAAWEAYDASYTDDLHSAGFYGGAFDGRYVYFIPWTNPQGRHHANWLRYDTLGAFADPQSWTACDASSTDRIKTIGYNGGAFDGRFLYAAPVCDDEAFHGRILRYDTLDEGAFALKYGDCGHNGGLSAAVPGPSFIVNAEQGPRSVSAHRTLAPGWHHIAGTYDGQQIRLYVDGKLAAARKATGHIERCAVPLSVGQFADGAAAFRGTIAEILIADTAYGPDEIARACGDRLGRTRLP